MGEGRGEGPRLVVRRHDQPAASVSARMARAVQPLWSQSIKQSLSRSGLAPVAVRCFICAFLGRLPLWFREEGLNFRLRDVAAKNFLKLRARRSLAYPAPRRIWRLVT